MKNLRRARGNKTSFSSAFSANKRRALCDCSAPVQLGCIYSRSPHAPGHRRDSGSRRGAKKAQRASAHHQKKEQSRVAVPGIAHCVHSHKYKAATRLNFNSSTHNNHHHHQPPKSRLDQQACRDVRAPGVTHLTFAATDDIASFLRFFLLDTAVPMLTWKRRRRRNSSFQTTRRDGVMRQ